jgi:hypothetical protein
MQAVSQVCFFESAIYTALEGLELDNPSSSPSTTSMRYIFTVKKHAVLLMGLLFSRDPN